MFYIRNLYEKGKQQVVTFKLLMVCNKVPPIKSMDNAIKNRIVIMPFASVWVDEPPKSEEEQVRQRRFKKNPRFELQLDSMAPAFLWLMCQEWSNYVREGLVKKPREYLKECNMLELYCSENITIINPSVGMPEDSPHSYFKHHLMRATTLYRHYKEWYNTLKSKHTNCMLISNFNKELSKMIGQKRLHKYTWLGMELNGSGGSPDGSLLGRPSATAQKDVCEEIYAEDEDVLSAAAIPRSTRVFHKTSIEQPRSQRKRPAVTKPSVQSKVSRVDHPSLSCSEGEEESQKKKKKKRWTKLARQTLQQEGGQRIPESRHPSGLHRRVDIGAWHQQTQEDRQRLRKEEVQENSRSTG